MTAQSSASISSRASRGREVAAADAGVVRRHGIERRTANVVSVDPAARLITCADGTVLTYDAALLAVGGEPTTSANSGTDRRNASCFAPDQMRTRSWRRQSAAAAQWSWAAASSGWKSPQACGNVAWRSPWWAWNPYPSSTPSALRSGGRGKSSMSAAESHSGPVQKSTAFDGGADQVASHWTQANGFRRIWLWWGSASSRRLMRSLVCHAMTTGA